jgi:RNA polymerase sigma-70 factor (ECF subfamily)
MQQAYVQAFQHLRQFQGNARFATWLVRIAVNEALMRLRRANRFVALDGTEPEEVIPLTSRPTRASPEEQAARRELVTYVERAVDELPDLYRSVFVLRDVEGMSTAESAEALELSEEVIKTRLHRAKALLREKLASFAESSLGSAFPFEAPRCDRVVAAVMERIGAARG